LRMLSLEISFLRILQRSILMGSRLRIIRCNSEWLGALKKIRNSISERKSYGNPSRSKLRTVLTLTSHLDLYRRLITFHQGIKILCWWMESQLNSHVDMTSKSRMTRAFKWREE
jgi:hypothetical protein